MNNKLEFGTIKALRSKTPLWATNIFRMSYLFTKVIIGWVAITKIFSIQIQQEITLFLTLFIDPLIYGLSKMFGITIEDKK